MTPSSFSTGQTTAKVVCWLCLTTQNWRNKPKSDADNNKTKTIGGKDYYTLVLGAGKGILQRVPFPEQMDKLGLFVLNEMVDGYVYVFKTKANRDNIFKWLNK